MIESLFVKMQPSQVFSARYLTFDPTFAPYIQVVAILGSLLEQVHREKSLKRKHGSKLVAYLLRHWGSFSSWWEGPFVADRQLAALGVLKRMFAIDPEVSCYSILQWSPS